MYVYIYINSKKTQFFSHWPEPQASKLLHLFAWFGQTNLESLELVREHVWLGLLIGLRGVYVQNCGIGTNIAELWILKDCINYLSSSLFVVRLTHSWQYYIKNHLTFKIYYSIHTTLGQCHLTHLCGPVVWP